MCTICTVQVLFQTSCLPPCALEVLEVVRKYHFLDVFVDMFAGGFNPVCHSWWPTAEYTEHVGISVHSLQHLEEGLEVWAAEVGDGPQAGEQGPVAYLLEVALADVQHGGPYVELLPELRDEDVDGHDAARVCVLHLADDVSHPLELLLGACDPQEVHLFALDLGPDLGLVSDVLKDGGEGRDPDTASHQHRHLVLVPLLVTLPVRAVQVDLGPAVLLDAVRVVGPPQVNGPRPDCPDVQHQVLLVRR